MIKEITLPEVSENIDKGDVVKVLVKEGDKIEVDQPVIELETDKAMFEVPSTEAGIVKQIKVKEGGSVKVGGVILTVETNGKAEKEESTEKKSKKPEEEPTKESEEKEEFVKVEKESEKESLKEEKFSDEESEKKIESKKPEPKKEKSAPAPAAPSVRRLARELGVEIDNVEGTGPSGRISEEDVKKHVKNLMQSGDGESVSIAQKALPDFSRWGEVETEKMSKVREVTAQSMTYAWTTIPHVTHFDSADITMMEEFRKKYGKKFEKEGGNLTITSILVKICEAALRRFPQFNSSIDMNRKEIIFKKYFNVGVAVDTDRGLLVPVIKDVNRKDLISISKELTELAEKAREKKITPAEMEGGNFTISNLGGIGGTNFTPIVYSPQVAILAVSRAKQEPVYIDGELKPRMIAPLALSYDHRVIDGADAARFLRWVCEALENPFSMLF